MSKTFTLTKVETIIDEHISKKENLMFVCSRDLAEFIVDYIFDEYELIDEVGSGIDDSEEYYVSLFFYNAGETTLVCESARVTSGRYKVDEVDNGDVYIEDCTDMCDITASKVLRGNRNIEWFDVDYEDDDDYYGEYGEYVCDGDCECCECEEIDDSEEEEIRVIGETIQKIFEVYPCPECVADAVMELAFRFRDIGWTNHKDYISACNED